MRGREKQMQRRGKTQNTGRRNKPEILEQDRKEGRAA